MNTTIILLLIFNLFATLFSIFWKSYFSEKGKNLATKKDIGIITKEIETVKTEISINFSKKNEFEKERKQIALSFFDTAYYFIDYSTQVTRIGNNLDDLNVIKFYIEDVRSQSAKVFSSYSKVLMYFDNDSDVCKTAGNLYDVAIKFQNSINELLIQLERLAQEKELLLDFLKKGDLRHQSRLLQITQMSKEIMEKHINFVFTLKEESHQIRAKYISALTKIIKLSL